MLGYVMAMRWAMFTLNRTVCPRRAAGAAGGTRKALR